MGDTPMDGESLKAFGRLLDEQGPTYENLRFTKRAQPEPMEPMIRIGEPEQARSATLRSMRHSESVELVAFRSDRGIRVRMGCADHRDNTCQWVDLNREQVKALIGFLHEAL